MRNLRGDLEYGSAQPSLFYLLWTCKITENLNGEPTKLSTRSWSLSWPDGLVLAELNRWTCLGWAEQMDLSWLRWTEGLVLAELNRWTCLGWAEHMDLSWLSWTDRLVLAELNILTCLGVWAEQMELSWLRWTDGLVLAELNKQSEQRQRAVGST
jgi:hypothetical protein